MVLLASLSPLLTFTRLWQLKEWRFDRLREHLRENGWWTQLFGKMRPALTLVLLITSEFFDFILINLLGLIIMVILNSVQTILLKKQPVPVWTSKAKSIVVFAAVLMGMVTFLIFDWHGTWESPWARYSWYGMLILPLLAPAFIMLSWIILSPLDLYLKNRVLNQAIRLRSAHPNLRVVGITGSVGKTTTKELLAHILKDADAVATPEHVNSEMGVANWLIKILKDKPRDAQTILIVEMGAYRKGEIATLCRIAQPSLGIITYIGQQHLSLFGSRDAIIQAKGELFAALPDTGRAFANSDNDAYTELIKFCRCPVTAVGTGQHANIQAVDLEETAQGLAFKTLDTVFNVPVAGTHAIAGILLAIAVAQELGTSPREIARCLTTFPPLKKTFEVKTIGSLTILDDTYNSSPDSVRAAIEWAKHQPQTNKILVLEGIIELGSAERKIHTDIAHLASEVFTVAYVAHARHLPYFRDGGFGSRVSVITESPNVPDGSLIVLSGRLSESTIKRFLP